MQPHQIHPLAILVAALFCFVLGGLWYSPMLFGRAWIRTNGFTDETLRRGSQPRIFALSFVAALIMATNLAFFLADSQTTLAWGAIAGALAGFGWVAMALVILGLFERRSWQWIVINGS